jgi:hypothetical protein
VRIDAGRGRPGVHPHRNQTGNVGTRLCDGHAGLESRHAFEAKAGQDQLGAIKRERADEVRLRAHEAKSFGHDADNLARLGVDRDGASNHITIATEAALPVSVAQNDRRRPAGRVFGGIQPAPQDRPNVKCLESARTHQNIAYLFRLSEPCDRRGGRNPHAERFEAAVLLGIRVEHRCGEAQVAGDARETLRAGSGVPDGNQPVGLGIGEWFKQNAVDDAEDGGVRADADRDRKQGDSREPRIVAQCAQGVAHAWYTHCFWFGSRESRPDYLEIRYNLEAVRMNRLP